MAAGQGIPASLLEIDGAALALLLLGWSLALVVSRNLDKAMTEVANAALALGRGSPAAPIHVRFKELVAVARAFGEADAIVRERAAQQKQAEAALFESEQRFRDIAEVSGDWIWEMDANLRYVQLKGESGRAAPRQLEGLVDKTRWELAGADPDEDPFWAGHRANLLAGRPFRNFRYSMRRSDGSLVFWRVSGKPIFDQQGVFRGYRGTASDETAVVEAQLRAEHAEALLRDAIDSITEGFVIYDADDRLVICNEAYRRVYPESADFMIAGTRFEDILRGGLARGQYAAAVGREEKWLVERMRLHREAGIKIEQQLSDGRWILVNEQRMRHGGIAGLRVEITELKQAQAALRASEARFRDISEVAGDWIWETGPDHRFTFFSGYNSGPFRIDPERVLGHMRWELAGGDPGRDEVWRRHKADLDARQPIRGFRYSFVRENGRRMHFLVNGKPVFDEAGTFIGYRGTATNETGTIEALRRAEEAEALLRDAIESIPDGFAIYDKEDRLVMCNEAYRGIFRHSTDYLVPGTSFEDLIRSTLVLGENFDALGCEEEWLVERLAQHRNPSGSHERRLADGRWLLVSERRMSNGGIAGLRVDITALKEAQAALRESKAQLDRAQRIAGIGSWQLDVRSGRFLWSKEMYRLCGSSTESLMPDLESVDAYIHPDDRHAVRDWFWSLSTGESCYGIEFRLQRPDGELRIVSAEGQALCDDSGKVLEVAGTLRDVTEQHMAERERVELQQQLAHSQKLEALGTLAGGVAHDLNNTLVPVLALTKLALKRVNGDAVLREDLETIQSAGIRARDLVKQILAFSRKEVVERQPLQLGEITREALTMLRASIPATIAIELHIADDPEIFGDPTQIHQVIVNLVTNAAQAIGPQHGSIMLVVGLETDDNGAVPACASLVVADTGCGMDKGTLDRMFEPFFTTKAVGEGTGLGLPVVHGIVTNHGGTIKVDSAPKKGTRFTIHLPLAGEHEGNPASEERIEA